MEEFISDLLRRGFFDTLEQILFYSPEELTKKYQIPVTKAREMVVFLSDRLVQPVELQWKELSTGITKLDEFFGGGLPIGQVIEIYGDSGSGKSTFAMQLCYQVQLPIEQGGLEGGALYISTSGRFSIRRLERLLPNSTEFMDHIHILHIRDLETQLHLLKYQIPLFIQRHNIKLLVIDSIAPNFRGMEEGGSEDVIKRAGYIYETGQVLAELASKCSMVVLLLNEVSAQFSNTKYVSGFGQGRIQETGQSEWEKSTITPALGNALSVCVNMRVRFEKVGERKKMTLVFSPSASNSTIEYAIEQSGIVIY
jgi:RecA/RadA recombinase